MCFSMSKFSSSERMYLPILLCMHCFSLMWLVSVLSRIFVLNARRTACTFGSPFMVNEHVIKLCVLEPCANGTSCAARICPIFQNNIHWAVIHWNRTNTSHRGRVNKVAGTAKISVSVHNVV